MSTSLVVVGNPDATELDTLTRLAAVLAKSGFYSKARTPEQAAALVLMGRELGVGAGMALAHLNCIEGKPAPDVQLMSALAAKGGVRWEVAHTDGACTVTFHRDGWKDHASTFTLADAQRANLTSKDNWKKYPRAMLFNRAFAEGARIIAPDLLGGACYTPEELGAERTDEHGGVVDVTPLASAALATAAPANGGLAPSVALPGFGTPDSSSAPPAGGVRVDSSAPPPAPVPASGTPPGSGTAGPPSKAAPGGAEGSSAPSPPPLDRDVTRLKAGIAECARLENPSERLGMLEEWLKSERAILNGLSKPVGDPLKSHVVALIRSTFLARAMLYKNGIEAEASRKKHADLLTGAMKGTGAKAWREKFDEACERAAKGLPERALEEPPAADELPF